MRKILLSTFVFTLSLIFHGCASMNSDLLVAEFENQKITLNDFEKAYAKNVGGFENAMDDSISDYKKFLDLYVNYKMKLRDAFVRGYYDDKDILDELNTYKKKVGSSYIIEKEIIEPGLKQFYEDRKYEMRISHILIRPDSISFDAAEKKAEEILERIKNGESFEEMAELFSADQYSRENGGDIYWAYPGQIISEFAQAALKTPVGEIYPEPVKTKYGYHIIKVTDRQKRRYKLRARHILVNFKNVDGRIDTTEAYEEITGIKNQLENGASFVELAKKYSDDRGSAENGGDLGFFSRRMMVIPFDEAVFDLEIGEISDIVRTRYGYHIIQLLEEEPYPSFQEDREELKRIYNRIRYDREYNEFVDSLKTKYNYTINNQLVNEIVNSPDSVSFTDTYWDTELHKTYGSKSIADVNSKPIIVDSVFAFGINDKKFSTKVINHNNNLADALAKYSNEKLIEEAALELPKINPEFASLMDDYKNGIYIFKLQEDEVWGEINIDSTELDEYYQENSDKYKWSNRVEFSEINVKKDSLANSIYQEIMNGADFDSLAKRYTIRPGFRGSKGHHELREVSIDGLTQAAWALDKPGDVSEPFEVTTSWSIVKLIRKEPARLKTYEEAKPEVISEYQEVQTKKLEEDYLNKLKKRYEPIYYYENLSKAFKNTSN